MAFVTNEVEEMMDSRDDNEEVELLVGTTEEGEKEDLEGVQKELGFGIYKIECEIREINNLKRKEDKIEYIERSPDGTPVLFGHC